MADLKKQHVFLSLPFYRYTKFFFIWDIYATETSEMLKVSSQEKGMETQVFEWVFQVQKECDLLKKLNDWGDD